MQDSASPQNAVKSDAEGWQRHGEAAAFGVVVVGAARVMTMRWKMEWK